jgi:hypothetical protein
VASDVWQRWRMSRLWRLFRRKVRIKIGLS